MYYFRKHMGLQLMLVFSTQHQTFQLKKYQGGDSAKSFIFKIQDILCEITKIFQDLNKKLQREH